MSLLLRGCVLLPLVVFTAVPVLGAEPAEGGGMPQLNPESFPPQLIWAAITFVALYFLMANVALPRISRVLEERTERIGEDLDKAAQLQQEGEAALADYEKALADARSEAQSLLRTAQEGIAKAGADAQERLGAELAAQARDAESRIAAARQAAVENVRTIAVDVAQSAAARLIGSDVDASRIAAAVDATMQERG